MKIKKKIQKIGAVAGLTACLVGANGIANAQDKSYLNSILKATAGWTTGAMIHEGSHYLTGEALGMEGMEVTPRDYSYENSKGDDEKAHTALAGPLASAITSRMTRNADTPFEKGLFAYSTWDGIQKAFFPNFLGSKNSDINELEESIGKDKTNLIRAGLAINALWNTYEYFYGDKKEKSNWEVYAGPHDKNGFKFIMKKEF